MMPTVPSRIGHLQHEYCFIRRIGGASAGGAERLHADAVIEDDDEANTSSDKGLPPLSVVAARMEEIKAVILAGPIGGQPDGQLQG